ncbi:hypothetical protein OG562_12495 [Streptomyces sp. NBC_01275]|uniref:hypothetical protein n=1 Tax=Streptomyces sp. NBC_01275 TaxID=2903807 RepID=UPI0022521E92|nr:hypothetical protein [Streptomyces sp. NBC_01275]MCX4761780.1 hypothetical protein [Streptomyces sp. NBC_01275]
MIILGLVILVAAALLGLSLILTGTRRTPRRRRPAHRRVEPSPRGSAAAEQARGGPIDERDTDRAQTAQTEKDEADPAGPADHLRRKDHWFRHRAAH